MDMARTRSDRPAHGKPFRRHDGAPHRRAWLPAVFLCLLAGSAGAQDARVHRCIGANGEPTFSDRPCEPTREMPATPSEPAQPEGALPPPGSGAGFTHTCPRSVDELRTRALAAFAARSSLSLSGLFLWDGFGQGSALAPLRDLARLIDEPLISIDIDAYAHHPQRDDYPDRYPDRYSDRREERMELVFVTVGEQERQVPYESVRRFEVIESAGCWWLLPAY
jgi:hypothetical protein